MGQASHTPELFARWAVHFNQRLAADALWDADPWAELAVALHVLSIPDPFPGTRAEWDLFFTRALDRFEEASGESLPPEMRALLRSIHPCRMVLGPDGTPTAR